MIDFRSTIKKALGKRSIRWLAKQPGVIPSHKHISDYLAGRADMTSERLASVLQALDLKVKR